MPSKAQIKAREAFVRKFAKKKKGSKTKIVYRLGGQIVSKKEYLRRERMFEDPNTMKRPKPDSLKKMRSRQYEPLLVKALQNGFNIPRGWYDLTPAQKLKKLNYFMGRE